jgi:transcriptional regulator with XRE-family HTH domain/tetratricopeptide (TPR) repeat protein
MAGLTQEDLAEASGVSVRALRELERGRAQAAQRRSAQALADALGLTGDDRDEFLSVAQEARRRTPRSAQAARFNLPPAVPDLVGREEELSRLKAAADGSVIAVVGHPGVGKTTLAVSVAHQLRPEFPDGCFLVDLRGMDDQPVTARAALDQLLQALGVPPARIPATEAEQAAMYRTMLEQRTVLVLLDNAADEAQVRPLIAAAPGCLTIVTCRRALAGLEAARWVWLDPLAEPDAVELLGTIVGRDRVLTEPEAAEELVSLCGNLPLAVRIAGNRLATRPHWSLAHLTAQLRDERTRLTSLSAGDLQVRSAFDMSYRRLSPGARLVFRRLAALPGVDFGAELAEVATGMTDSDVSPYLDELADASLLQTTPTPGRFQFHDLIRLFATERWEDEDKPAERDKVTCDVLDHLLGTATAAGLAIFPENSSATEVFATKDEAVDWLAREELNWIAAQRLAARLGRHREVIEVAKAMHRYSDTQWMGLPWTEIFSLGVAGARALGDRRDEAKLLNFVGWSQIVCDGDADAALISHEQALAIAVEADDRLEQAWAHAHVASVLRRLATMGRVDRLDEALDHMRLAGALSEEFGFWTVQVSVRNRLGRIFQALERWDEALSVHSELLADTIRRDDEVSEEQRRWQATLTRIEVGRCLFAKGEWRHAAETFRETREALIAMGAAGPDADAAMNEGKAWLEAGEYARARESLRYALEAYGDSAPADRREQVLAALARLPAE